MIDDGAPTDGVTARQTGQDAALMDILHKDVSLDSIWELLTYEIHVRKDALKTQKLQNLLAIKGWVSKESIETYEKLLKRQGGDSLGDLLADQGIIDDRQLGELNAQMAGVALEDIDHAPIELDDIVLMDPELMTQAEAVLVCRQDNRLKVAFKDLATLPLLNDVRVYTGYPIEPVAAPRTQIRERIAHVRELAKTDAYARARSLFETRRDIETTHETEAVVRLLDSVLAEAFAVHATDVHFESKDDGLRVRYRIDGELHTALEMDQSIAPFVMRRICDNCRVPYTPDPRLTDRLERAAGHELGITEFVHGTGCHLCRESGFSGRLGVFEVCSVDEALGDAIARGLSKDELRQAATEHGMILLVHSGVHRVGSGETTVEEVLKLGIA